MDYEALKEIFDFVHSIAMYILGGLAYKALLDSYMGFIPIFGDFICKCKIADEYDNESKKPYMITYFLIISIIIIIIFYLVFINVFFAYSGFGSLTFFSLMGLSIFVIGIIYLYYSYKIIYPLVQDITGEENVGIASFLFVIIPIVFYIWLLVKTKNMKEEEF